jgi:hypothetical protein
VALGAEHIETPGLKHLLLLGRDFLADLFDRFVLLGPLLHLAELVLDAEVDVAAELDVGAAAGHVGRDRHRPEAAGLRDDMRFLLVEAGVQH